MGDKPKRTPDDRWSDDFLTGAYGLDGLADALAFYGEWAEAYDERMEQRLGYVAPRLIAERLARHLDDRAAVILDVGCGTGLTSHYLADLGFTTFDGVDVSPGMLDKARERGIYRALFEMDITEPMDMLDAAYDAAVSSGTFTLGHVGAAPIDEIWRVLKPGALFACTFHKDIWAPQGFEASFAALEDAGALRPVEIVLDEFFKGLGETAMYCVFQKLEPASRRGA